MGNSSQYVNGTNESEASEYWLEVINELDRQEYNNDHKETRRHVSLDTLNLDDSLIPSDVNIEKDYEKKERMDDIYQAIKALTPQQQKLITDIYFHEKRAADIAKEDGVSDEAIKNRLNRIFVKLRRVSEFGG